MARLTTICLALALLVAPLAGCQLTRKAARNSANSTAVASKESELKELPVPEVPTVTLAGTEDSPPSPVIPASFDLEIAPDADQLSPQSVAGIPAIEQAEFTKNALDLTLDDAIAISLDRNPSLIALRASEPVAHAAFHVAEVYPWNPYVQIEVLPYAREAGGGLGATTNYVLLMQTLELAHQRRYREANAAGTWSQVRWNIVQAELTTAAQTQGLFFAAMYRHDVLQLQREVTQLNTQVSAVVERRFQAALATPAERNLAKLSLRQARNQELLAEAALQTALLALHRQMNLTGSGEVTLEGRLQDFKWLPVGDDYGFCQSPDADSSSTSQLAATLASDRPDVMAAAAGLRAARANASLARANRIPNPQLGPFYERDDAGTVFAGFRAQTNLPIWDTGKPLLRQRQTEVRQRITELEQLRARAIVEAETAIERYDIARSLYEETKVKSERSTPDELQQLQDLFEGGQADLLNIFAAQSSLLQERRLQLDLLNEVAQAAADVSLSTGLPPARLIAMGQARSAEAECLPLPVAAPEEGGLQAIDTPPGSADE